MQYNTIADIIIIGYGIAVPLCIAIKVFILDKKPRFDEVTEIKHDANRLLDTSTITVLKKVEKQYPEQKKKTRKVYNDDLGKYVTEVYYE